MNEDIKKSVKDAVDGFFPQAVDLSCALAAEPELSGVEFKSAERIKAVLSEAGFKIEAPFCDMPTAFKAVFENGSGPKVALLAEYDALPGVGHGCGHNLSGALSVLAASALVKLAPLFKGTLIVFGTPDE